MNNDDLDLTLEDSAYIDGYDADADADDETCTVDVYTAFAQYDNDLNNCNEMIVVGSLEFYPADVLKNCDPVAYHRGFNNWLDFSGLELE